MKYLLVASHATLARGIKEALEMLLGARSYVLACGMEDGMTPDAYRAGVFQALDSVTSEDEVVVLADIAGGSPLKNALVALDDKGMGDKVLVLAGANLPMAISAVMGIDDGLDLDAIRDAMLADGSSAVKQV
ncbi:MAG: PTS sugar transporter subunit IIA [Atopobiaceae bacterium]|nr:PTS sugar transporter subunit IIA [Atopobiaceae bacterium]